ncbi:sulfur carrier protein ThiS [Alkalihalobacillus deserti]|uniref:sulfur carrier protein ThiS n=1 Tax=Alkalihalobacillus deserti TaxID=2879466 RepID=UPI001D14E576|nr:sulfur carrier protein ThiS [Alkalihalobacillus deserti]
MKLIINGDEKEISGNTLEEIVKHYDLEMHLVVIELEGEIIESKNWSNTKLAPGMRIELVHFVGGG